MVKTFDTLYAELAAKAAERPEGSGTVAQLDAGVHAIGKKIVEEAAEVWMAAEYESTDAAAEEISQLLYHLQVLMLAKGISPRGCLPTSLSPRPRPSSNPKAAAAMLRIAVPNKGSLAETASEMLHEAGYTGRRDPKDLHVIDPQNEVEFFYLRPKDIATYVGSGALDVGITGRDLLLDARMPGAREIEQLGFAASTFRFAAPAGRFTEVTDLEGARIATSYPGLVDGFLDEHGVAADLVPLDGAVESAVELGVADAIADVVETGTTLRQAGLVVFGPVILKSEAVLIGAPTEADGTATLLRRLRGVLVAQRYVHGRLRPARGVRRRRR